MAAFRGSEIKFPSPSYFVAAVDPGLWDQSLLSSKRYQWKSIPKQQRKLRNQK